MTHEPDLHTLLAARSSPATFDQTHEASEHDIATLIEAARWAPSAGNAQPWGFITSRRGDPAHERMVKHLAGSSRQWAPTASILVANLSHRFVEDTDWDYSEFSLYDLGQAVAHMTIQATALGLRARQFRAFDRHGIATEFSVPRHWQVTTMTAFGLSADHDRTRERRPVSELLWGQALD